MTEGRNPILLFLFPLLLLSVTGVDAAPSHQIALIEWQEDGPVENGFRQGLQKVFPEVRFWVYNAGGNEELLKRHIEDARSRRPDLYYVSGTPATRRLLERVTDAPVVFTGVQDPVGEKIIAQWSTSANNATGIGHQVPVLNQLRALVRVRKFSRLGVIYDGGNPDSRRQVSELARLQPILGFELVRLPLEAPEDSRELSFPGNPPFDALYLASDPLVNSLAKTILPRINSAGIPTLAADMTLVTRHGALLGLVPDSHQVGRLAALQAVALLRGAPPSSVPSRDLDHFMVVINMRTAQAISVQVPFSLLVIADTIVR